MDEPAIRTSDLKKYYGDIKAVDGLNLRVNAGEMFALVGPDGAGKTSTIRMLCGITEPTAGKASVLGHTLPAGRDKIVSRIGYLSQKFSLYGDLTVDENIEFFAEIHNVKEYKKLRTELLDYMRLTPFRSRRAEDLSGGMKQKLALSCTLIHKPDILFLDEPTTGVDPVSRRDFWRILSDLLKRGITILMTTPYMDEAERCSRVGLMNNGNLIVADTPEGIKRLMKGTVVEIIADPLREAARLIKGTTGVRGVQIFGDRLNLIIDGYDTVFPAIQNLLEHEKMKILSSRVVLPTLENIFISLAEPHHGK